jgi:Spy/CpxP family protein refolding chaperone
MKRIALLGLSVAGAAGLLATSLIAAESDAAKPAPSPTAETPAKKDGCEGKKFGHRGPGEFGRGHGRERFSHRGGPGGGPEGFRRHGGPGGPGGLDRMLNLTDEQKAKVKEIMEANKPKIEAIRKEEMAKIKAVMDDSMKQIEPLLTADQKQVLADMENLRKSREKLSKDKAE